LGGLAGSAPGVEQIAVTVLCAYAITVEGEDVLVRGDRNGVDGGTAVVDDADERVVVAVERSHGRIGNNLRGTRTVQDDQEGTTAVVTNGGALIKGRGQYIRCGARREHTVETEEGGNKNQRTAEKCDAAPRAQV
jgi:hypothetical protein